ncbi:hypothetical protein RCL_jg23845.t1 [Rhizophagus clarus]|uniref:TNFR-Cys domain-containing protein n=1 Tax=Rhizophagus clarus TaxID=94130 RepID=A0A8H3LRJ8_9GLOM|nr:hypothetical protein RCL_jg23845.t1 [Rhizophagus clarus]
MNFPISFLFILGLTCFFFIFDTSASCNPTTPCVGCLPQGQYCGGEIGHPGCDPTHVYECNPECGTCDYGVRESCKICGHLTCD